MIRPVRFRLSRAKGFDLQTHSRGINGLPAINVARPGPFGNPYVIGRDGTRERCVQLYALTIVGCFAMTATPTMAEKRTFLSTFGARWRELIGHNLACWCALDGKPCHADTLLRAVAIKEAEHP